MISSDNESVSDSDSVSRDEKDKKECTSHLKSKSSLGGSVGYRKESANKQSSLASFKHLQKNLEYYISSDEEKSKENDKSENSEIKVPEVACVTEADLKHSPISSKKGQGYSARNIMVKQRKPLVSSAIIA